jgi:hypothetical protein
MRGKGGWEVAEIRTGAMRFEEVGKSKGDWSM